MKKQLILIVGMAVSCTSITLQAQFTNKTTRVVERGAYFETIEMIESHTNRSTGLILSKTNRITTLKAGMFRQANGEWVKTNPEIKPATGGAKATGGEHEVFFRSDVAAPMAIQITMPNGNRLSGNVLGL